MSHQRSKILLVALGVIVIYLWYESMLLSKPNQNVTSTEVPTERVKTRRLLSVGDLHPMQDLEQAVHKTEQSKNFSSLPKIKTGNDEIFNWEISFNVNKLQKESLNSSLRSTEPYKKKPKDDSVYLEVYLNGSKQSYKEFHHTWSSVDEFVKNLFLKISPKDLTTKESDNFITREKEITTKFPPQSMKRKEGKFLSSIFNFGGGGGSNNKENPAIELGDDDALQNKTVTEIMHDITFVNTTNAEEREFLETSSIHQDTKKQDSSSEISEFVSHISNTSQSSDVTNCENCTLEKPPISTASKAIENNQTVSRNLTSDDAIMEDIAQFDEKMCVNWFNNLRNLDFIEFSGAENETVLIEKIKETIKGGPSITTEFTEIEKEVLKNISKRLSMQFGPGKISKNSQNIIESSTETEKESINGIYNKTDPDSRNFVLPTGFSVQQCENFIKITMLNRIINQTDLFIDPFEPNFFTNPVFDDNSEKVANENISYLEKINFKVEEKTDVFNLLSTSSVTNLEVAAFTEANANIATNNLLEDYDIPKDFLDIFAINTGTIHLNEETDDLFTFGTLFESEEKSRNKSGRGVSELSKDEFLEIGSDDESRIFNFFGSGGREISDNEQTTLPQSSQERIFVPGFFNFGSGSREIDDDLLEKELIINPTTESEHSERFFGFPFGSGERMIPDVTFDSRHSKVTEMGNQLPKSEMVTLENKFETYDYSEIHKTENGHVKPVSLDSAPTKESTLQTINEYFDSLNYDKKTTSVPSIPSTECTNCEKIANPYVSPNEQDKKPQSPNQLIDHKITICQDCEPKSDNTATVKDDFSILSKPVNKNEVNKSPRRLFDFEDTFCPDCESLEQTRFDKPTELSLNSNIIPLENSNSLEEIQLTNTRLDILEKTVSTITPSGIIDNVNSKDTDSVNSNVLVLPADKQNEVSSQRPQNRRGGRAHDVDSDWNIIPNKITQSVPKTTMFPSEFGIKDVEDNEKAIAVYNEKHLNEEDPLTNNFLNLENIEFNNISPSEKSNTEVPPLLSTSENLFKNFASVSFDNSKFNTSSLVPKQTSDVPVSHVIHYPDVKGITNPKIKTVPKFCQSARECNNALGERCFSKQFGSVCDCARGFVRNPENRRCEAPVIMRTSMWLPKERFHKDLYDQTSKLYKQKRDESLETMWLLLQNNPELFLSVAELDVKGYEAGSLIVIWNMKVVIEANETVPELVNKIEENLKEIVKNNAIENIPLNIQNASTYVAAINPCLQKEMNYCHEKAECKFNERDGLSCMCKEGYQDNSKLNGEECVASCTEDYCGDHGECKLKLTGERHCLCTGWYIGWKCEISGIVVLCGFSAANVVIVFIVLMFVCVFKRRNRNNDFYRSNVENFQSDQAFQHNQRVMDIIALDNVAISKGSKFVTVSTPNLEQTPVIEITSPSFPGSSIDYDSTFDRSRFSEQNSKYEYDITRKI